MRVNLIKTCTLFLFISGCVAIDKKPKSKNVSNQIPIKEHSVLAVLWQQNAAEYRALCYQAFNTARFQLNEIIKYNKAQKPLAIITDIDETILDNTAYSAQLIIEDDNYNPDSWLAWGKHEKAPLLPGAKEFINHVSNLGIEIFYVSNRYDIQIDETINNLKKHGLANADYDHVYLRSNTSGKEQRRNKISLTHKVVMLLGDNLSDFDDIFDNKNTVQRNQHVENLKHSFGHNFIVFPNPMYGDWETKGIYDASSLSENAKTELRRQKLRL